MTSDSGNANRSAILADSIVTFFVGRISAIAGRDNVALSTIDGRVFCSRQSLTKSQKYRAPSRPEFGPDGWDDARKGLHGHLRR